MSQRTGQHEVAVVGAGQAGLAVGHFLREQGRDFVILERADEIAPAWRHRWDSLKLFTPRRFDSLPGMDFPGDPDGYPGRDEVVSYLDRYAERFELPLRLSTSARALRHESDAFEIEVDAGRVLAQQVVIATGPFQEPRVPESAAGISDEVIQLHSTQYRNPSDLPAGRILVVGGGNTGYQIAEELAATREVHLAVGGRQVPLPQRFLGRDLFWWLTKTGLINKTVETKVGKRARERDTLVGSNPRKAKRRGITMHGRATSASNRTVTFDDGTSLEVDAVVWATGFRSDYSWIHLPVTDERGRVVHRRGVTDIPGLYMLGLQWQYTRGSALVGWVKDDAAYIAERIAEYQPRRHPAPDDSSPPTPSHVVTAGGGD